MGNFRFRSFMLCVAICGAVVASAGVSPPSAGAAVTAKTALVYGDSLMWESRFAVANQFAVKTGWTVWTHTFPATAPCDWLTWLPADLAAYRPSVVSLSTAGNSWSTCMRDTNGVRLPTGSPEYYARYAADLDAMFAMITATGAKVVFITAPPMLDPVRHAAIIEIARLATVAAARYPRVSISGTPRAAVAKNGAYTATKPCLATETLSMGCINGIITIRTVTGSDTGLHFCPTGLTGPYPWPCAVYSSGAYRFGKAVANVTASPPKPVAP